MCPVDVQMRKINNGPVLVKDNQCVVIEEESDITALVSY